jgi:hypothetical protein
MLESSLAVVYKRFIVSFCALQAFSIVFQQVNIENEFDQLSLVPNTLGKKLQILELFFFLFFTLFLRKNVAGLCYFPVNTQKYFVEVERRRNTHQHFHQFFI